MRALLIGILFSALFLASTLMASLNFKGSSSAPADKGEIERGLYLVEEVAKCRASEVAAQMVIEQAQPGKTEVRVLNVLRPPTLLVAREMVGYDPALENSWEMRAEAARTMAESVAARVRAMGISTSSSVELGEPRAKILEVTRLRRSCFGTQRLLFVDYPPAACAHLIGDPKDFVPRI